MRDISMTNIHWKVKYIDEMCAKTDVLHLYVTYIPSFLTTYSQNAILVLWFESDKRILSENYKSRI